MLLLDYNPRHYSQTQTDKQPVKHVFEDFTKIENIMDKIVEHDWDRMLVHRIVQDTEQLRRIKN